MAVRLAPGTGYGKRILVAMGVTDEIFGLSSTQKIPLNPMYNIGAMSVACPGWVLGTALGGIMGQILPSILIEALSVALYAMFIAIIIPPAKENSVIATAVILSMILSFLFEKISFFSWISSGIKVMIITLLLSSVFALLFPIRENNIGVDYE